MMVLRLIFIVLLFLVSLQANARNNNYEVWKEQVFKELGIVPMNDNGDVSYAYGNDTLAVRNLVNRRTKEAQEFVISHGNSPVIFWVLGAVGQYRYVFYMISVENEQGYYNPNTSDAKALREKEYQSYYRKALDLDEAVDAPEHLTDEMCSGQQNLATLLEVSQNCCSA